VASSLLGHIGSLAGQRIEGLPVEEASLLSAAIQNYEIDPATPVEDVLAFRERNRGSLGRFRASLSDLREELQQNGSPEARLSSARDTYRNRVEPALGRLEDSLNESGLVFFLKSVTGASVIVLAPIEPTRAVEGAAQLTAQTIRYAFSRKRMIEEHPFGFLHRLSTELGAQRVQEPTRLLERLHGDLDAVIANLLLEDYPLGQLMDLTILAR
jgi:hypothetical protein